MPYYADMSVGRTQGTPCLSKMANSYSGGTDEYFLERLTDILAYYNGISLPNRPTPLSDHVYIGSYADAKDIEHLKKCGITHILNMAAVDKSGASPYASDSGIEGYLQFFTDDNDVYPIFTHFNECKQFIDSAKRSGGKTLVHCAKGINRSSAICIAYIMVDERLDLLEVTKRAKNKRGTLLNNKGFQKQLVQFARPRGLLKYDGLPKSKQITGSHASCSSIRNLFESGYTSARKVSAPAVFGFQASRSHYGHHLPGFGAYGGFRNFQSSGSFGGYRSYGGSYGSGYGSSFNRNYGNTQSGHYGSAYRGTAYNRYNYNIGDLCQHFSGGTGGGQQRYNVRRHYSTPIKLW